MSCDVSSAYTENIFNVHFKYMNEQNLLKNLIKKLSLYLFAHCFERFLVHVVHVTDKKTSMPLCHALKHAIKMIEGSIGVGKSD